MANKDELHVGMRVKVVAPDPNGRWASSSFVGRIGTIVYRWNDTGKVTFPYEWCVSIDDSLDDPWPFTSQELAPLEEATATATAAPVERKLTKEKRDRLRGYAATKDVTDLMRLLSWATVDELLDDLDAADAEIARLTQLANDTYEADRGEINNLDEALQRLRRVRDGATVLEGVVSIADDFPYIDTDDEVNVESVYRQYVGKRVRVTVEVLGESEASSS